MSKIFHHMIHFLMVNLVNSLVLLHLLLILLAIVHLLLILLAIDSLLLLLQVSPLTGLQLIHLLASFYKTKSRICVNN